MMVQNMPRQSVQTLKAGCNDLRGEMETEQLWLL